MKSGSGLPQYFPLRQCGNLASAAGVGAARATIPTKKAAPARAPRSFFMNLSAAERLRKSPIRRKLTSVSLIWSGREGLNLRRVPQSRKSTPVPAKPERLFAALKLSEICVTQLRSSGPSDSERYLLNSVLGTEP